MDKFKALEKARAIRDNTDLAIFIDKLANKSNNPYVYEDIFWHFLNDENFDVKAECIEALMSVLRKNDTKLIQTVIQEIANSLDSDNRYSLRMSSIMGISEIKFNSKDHEISLLLYDRYIDPNEEDGIKGACFVALLKIFFGITSAESFRRNGDLILGFTTININKFEKEIKILKTLFG